MSKQKAERVIGTPIVDGFANYDVEVVAVEIGGASRGGGERPQRHAGERFVGLQSDYGAMRVDGVDSNIRGLESLRHGRSERELVRNPD